MERDTASDPETELCVCMHAKSLQSCLTLCDPMDCNPPGSSVHEILQARILAWVAIPPPGDLPHPEVEPTSLLSPALAGGLFTTSAPGEAENELYTVKARPYRDVSHNLVSLFAQVS